MVDLEEFDSTPYFLDEREIDFVRQEVLREYQEKLRVFQKEMDDPWILKWDYE